MDAYFGVDFYGNGEVVNLGELKKCEIVLTIMIIGKATQI